MLASPTLNDLFILLFAAACLHGVFLSIVIGLNSRRENSLPWLALSLLIISCWLANYLIYLSELIRDIPQLLGVFVPGLYLLGPVYYFFIVKTIRSENQLTWWHFLHALPFLYALWSWWPVYQWSAEIKLRLIEQVYLAERPPVGQLLLADLPGLLLLVYLIMCLSALGRWKRQSALTNSNRILWANRLTLILLCVSIGKLVLPILFWVGHWDASSLELLLVLLLALSVHLIGYQILGKGPVVPEQQVAQVVKKYQTSPLDPGLLADYRQQLLDYMERERPWLSADFNAAQLAQSLQVPAHHLSQVLSASLQTSFFDLVNHYRILEVKRRLRTDSLQKYSIQGIALDCGFGSKSSFNRAFKKETGMSPTQWLNSVALN